MQLPVIQCRQTFPKYTSFESGKNLNNCINQWGLEARRNRLKLSSKQGKIWERICQPKNKKEEVASQRITLLEECWETQQYQFQIQPASTNRTMKHSSTQRKEHSLHIARTLTTYKWKLSYMRRWNNLMKRNCTSKR